MKIWESIDLLFLLLSISVQRVYAHESIYDALKAKLVENVKGFKSGDPMYLLLFQKLIPHIQANTGWFCAFFRKEDTFLGPMINENAAKRLHRWVHEVRCLIIAK